MSSHHFPEPWTIERGDGPVIAAAIHSGSDLRPQVAAHLAISSSERFREEDPFTGDWASVGDSSVVVHRSRFEVDLNRPRSGAVYAAPIDCWNLKVSEGPIPREVIENSLRLYDRFYLELGELLEQAAARWGRLLVLDLHSYNHRREGTPADPAGNPDVNIGTIGAARSDWGPVIDLFTSQMRRFEVGGRALDVRENVKFRGGHLVRWIADRLPNACPLAIEVKKIYMDELTGVLDGAAFKQVHRALEAAASACRHELMPR